SFRPGDESDLCSIQGRRGRDTRVDERCGEDAIKPPGDLSREIWAVAVRALGAPHLARLLARHRPRRRGDAPPGVRSAIHSVRQAQLASDDLSSRDRAARTTGQRRLALKVVVPLASIVLALFFAEALVRLLASPTPAGPTFLDTLLLPRSWNDV